MLFWLTYYLIWLPVHIIAPFRVIGKNNYSKRKNYVLVCNHQSNFDPILLDFTFRKRIRFIAKKELFKKKTSSFLFKNILGAIPIDREKGVTISQTKEIYNILKNNEFLGIFPEGTRREGLNKDDKIKGGACLFAIKTKTPILPCFIVNKQKNFKKNTIIIGKPFELSEFYDKKLDKENIEKAENILRDKIIEIGYNYQKVINEKMLVKALKRERKSKKV